jgi:hypothetical protein
VSPGFHDGELELYAIEGGIFGFGGTEVYKDSATFTVTVEDYGNN